MKRIDALHEFKTLTDALFDELLAAIRFAHEARSPFARRTYVRTAFSLVEGMMFRMKQCALAVHAEEGPLFTEGEVALLKEETYDLDDFGAVAVRPKFLPLKRNIRLACAVFAKANRSEHTLDVQGKGWQDFRTAVEIRNRVVHPKKLLNSGCLRTPWLW